MIFIIDIFCILFTCIYYFISIIVCPYTIFMIIFKD